MDDQQAGSRDPAGGHRPAQVDTDALVRSLSEEQQERLIRCIFEGSDEGVRRKMDEMVQTLSLQDPEAFSFSSMANVIAAAGGGQETPMAPADVVLTETLRSLKFGHSSTHGIFAASAARAPAKCDWASCTVECADGDALRTVRCGDCHQKRYCSKLCQSADWHAGHKQTCESVSVQGQMVAANFFPCLQIKVAVTELPARKPLRLLISSLLSNIKHAPQFSNTATAAAKAEAHLHRRTLTHHIACCHLYLGEDSTVFKWMLRGVRSHAHYQALEMVTDEPLFGAGWEGMQAFFNFVACHNELLGLRERIGHAIVLSPEFLLAHKTSTLPPAGTFREAGLQHMQVMARKIESGKRILSFHGHASLTYALWHMHSAWELANNEVQDFSHIWRDLMEARSGRLALPDTVRPPATELEERSRLGPEPAMTAEESAEFKLWSEEMYAGDLVRTLLLGCDTENTPLGVHSLKKRCGVLARVHHWSHVVCRGTLTLQCAKCNSVWYCNAQCQQHDREQHKSLCLRLQSVGCLVRPSRIDCVDKARFADVARGHGNTAMREQLKKFQANLAQLQARQSDEGPRSGLEAASRARELQSHDWQVQQCLLLVTELSLNLGLTAKALFYHKQADEQRQRWNENERADANDDAAQVAAKADLAQQSQNFHESMCIDVGHYARLRTIRRLEHALTTNTSKGSIKQAIFVALLDQVDILVQSSVKDSRNLREFYCMYMHWRVLVCYLAKYPEPVLSLNDAESDTDDTIRQGLLVMHNMHQASRQLLQRIKTTFSTVRQATRTELSQWQSSMLFDMQQRVDTMRHYKSCQDMTTKGTVAPAIPSESMLPV